MRSAPGGAPPRGVIPHVEDAIPVAKPPIAVTSSVAYQFLKDSVLREETKQIYAEKLNDAGYESLPLFSRLTPQKLNKMGITHDVHIEEILELASSLKVATTNSPKKTPFVRSLLFFSYAKVDTIGETGILYDFAINLFPDKKIFRDAESAFKLSELVDYVKNSRNVVILLSGQYAQRPYTLVELHCAIESGARICPVKVTREGMAPFNFEAVKSDIVNGRVSTYLDRAGWKTLEEYGIGPREVEQDLRIIMNVRAFDYSSSFAKGVRDAMLQEIFTKGITME
jgi:hypothetical protein